MVTCVIRWLSTPPLGWPMNSSSTSASVFYVAPATRLNSTCRMRSPKVSHCSSRTTAVSLGRDLDARRGACGGGAWSGTRAPRWRARGVGLPPAAWRLAGIVPLSRSFFGARALLRARRLSTMLLAHPPGWFVARRPRRPSGLLVVVEQELETDSFRWMFWMARARAAAPRYDLDALGSGAARGIVSVTRILSIGAGVEALDRGPAEDGVA